MKTTIKILIWTIVLIVALSGSALAQTEGAELKTLSPYFFVANGDASLDQLPLKDTKVSVTITGVIADVTVSQEYENKGTRPINAQYIFPASTRAAVYGMTMTVGNEVIRAKIKEKQAAKTEFEQAKKQGKNASLLEQKRPNVFSMNVANIMPNERIVVELKYSELLVPTDGTYEFVYPTVVGPRYSNKPDTGDATEQAWVKNPYLHQGEPSRTRFDITTTVASPLPISELNCRTHKTVVDFKDDKTAEVALASSEKNGGNRDYILSYRLQGQQIQSGLMLYKGETENFFLFMAEPPQRVSPETIPARDYLFVVDVSGSMNGFPLTVAKNLLKDLMAGLRSTDTFNVLLFAGGSQVLSQNPLAASIENTTMAMKFIDTQKGGGGTELYPALKTALDMPLPESTSRSILVITDGYVDAEKEVFGLVNDNLSKSNVFAFGIGSSVNRHLIEGLAKAGRGEPFVVTEQSGAPGIAKTFREYISTPVLTGIKVRTNGFATQALEPQQIPDMFAKRPVVVFGKWTGEPQGTIEITGKTGAGDYRAVIDVSTIKMSKTAQALRYLWARKRIEALSDFEFGTDPYANKAGITELGLTYNLLTKHTSFIAVRETLSNTGNAADNVAVPLPLPQGVSDLAVGAEPDLAILLMLAGTGLICIIIKRQGKAVGVC